MPPRKVRLDVETTSDTRAFDKTARSVDDLGDEFTKVGKKAAGAVPVVAGLADEVDDLGDEAKQSERQMAALGQEIEATELKIKRLSAAFVETGGDKSIGKSLRSERGLLADLNRAKKVLEPILPDEDDGRGSGKKFSKGFGDAIGAIPSQLKGLLIIGAVGGAIAAAPAVGAAIGGAVAGTTGLGGVAGGLALAARDPRVKGAATDLVTRLGSVFEHLGDPFIGPAIAALDTLGATISDLFAGDVGDALQGLAPLVDDLADGVAGLVRELGPGLADALRNSKPFLHVLATQLPEIGKAIGQFLERVSSSRGALMGLRAALGIASGAIVAAGIVINALSDAFDGMVQATAAITGGLEDVFQALSKIAAFGGPATAALFALLAKEMGGANDVTERWIADTEAAGAAADGATAPIRGLGVQVDIAARAAKEAADPFQELFGIWMSVDQAAIAVQQSYRDLAEAIDESGGSLDIATEKGGAAAKSLLDGVEAAKAHRQAMIDDGKSVAAANDVYLEEIQRLRWLALQHGANVKAIDALILKYISWIALPDTTKTVTIRQVFTSQGRAFVPFNGVPFMSAGGPVRGRGPQGVDSVPVMAAPGEYMLNTDMVAKLGGLRSLENLRGGGGNSYMPPAPPPPAGGGGTMVRQPIQLVTPYGKVLHETMVEFACDTGRTPLQLWSNSR